MTQGTKLLASSSVMRREKVVDQKCVWMSILCLRASQIAFYVTSIQQSVMQAIVEIKDE